MHVRGRTVVQTALLCRRPPIERLLDGEIGVSVGTITNTDNRTGADPDVPLERHHIGSVIVHVD